MNHITQQLQTSLSSYSCPSGSWLSWVATKTIVQQQMLPNHGLPWWVMCQAPTQLNTHGGTLRTHLSIQVTQESASVSSMNRHFCHSLHHHKCHRYRNHWSSSKIKHYPILIITSQTPDQILLVLPGGGDYTHFPQQRQIIVLIIIIVIQLCMLFVIIIIIQLCCHHQYPTSK